MTKEIHFYDKISCQFRLGFLMLLLFYTKADIFSQSSCDPKSIVGAWQSVPSGFDQLLGINRIWCFYDDGVVEFYNLNPATRQHELNGQAKYSLDNPFQPRKVFIAHENYLDQPIQNGLTTEFTLLSLTEDYFIWIPLIGIGEIRYERVSGVENPHLLGGTFRGIASREELLNEMLKWTLNTSEETFQYLQNNSLTDLSDALGLAVDAKEISDFLLSIQELTKIHAVRFFVEEIVWSEIENLFSEAHYQGIYDDLVAFDEKLCSMLNEQKQRKVDYDEWHDNVRIFNPEYYRSEKFRIESNELFY